MNSRPYRDLKIRYKLFFTSLVLLSIALGAFPAYEAVSKLAITFNIDPELPVKDQGMGWLFVFLLLFVSISIVGCIWVLLSIVAGKAIGWDFMKIKTHLLLGRDYPSHWFKN